MALAKANVDDWLFRGSVAMLVMGLALGFALLPSLGRYRNMLATGQESPNVPLSYVLNAPGGNPRGELQDHLGHPVILDFWATWCGPCRAEAPVVDRIARRYREQGLVVLGINTSDERESGKEWARKTGLTYPIAFDEGNQAARSFGVENLPTLVVVDKQGKIAAVRTGLTDDAELERLLTQLF